MTKYNCQKICEIGVRQGFNFQFMTEHRPELAVAVDCWKDDGIEGHNDAHYPQHRLDRQYKHLKDWAWDKPFVKICRGYSFDVVKEFPDEYFDFIFVDADHSYEGVSRDLVDWYPKVKKGGVFIGHDYRKYFSGVVKAVDEFVKKNNIPNFFTLEPNPMWGIIK